MAGDQLISVEGKQLTRDTFSKLMGLRRTPAMRPIRLVARRNGRTRTYSINQDMSIVMPIFNVDVNGAFNGFYSSDFVYVTNISGTELTNAFLFVDIAGKHGADARNASDNHMHFVKSWPAGETRVLRYMSTATSDFASDESVDQIMNLQFRIYSDQFTQRENYTYTATAFTEDVQRYVKDIKFTARWYSYSDDHLFYNSGVTIKTVDGSAFPATSMTLTVSSGSVVKSFKYNISNDVFDGNEYFSHSDFNGMSVDRIDVSFDLPYTDHSIDAYSTF
jgi:hypothetical protein